MGIFEIFLSAEAREEIKKAREFGVLAPKIIEQGVADLRGESALLDEVMQNAGFLPCAMTVAVHAATNKNEQEQSPLTRTLLREMLRSCDRVDRTIRTMLLQHFDFVGRVARDFMLNGCILDPDVIKTASGLWMLCRLGYAQEQPISLERGDEKIMAARTVGGWLHMIFMNYWTLYKDLLQDEGAS